MSLDEMLDVMEIVNNSLEEKQNRVPLTFNPKVRRFANRIIELSQDDKTKPRANAMLASLNHRIVQENINTCDSEESELIYNTLMRGTIKHQCNKM